MTAQKQEYNQFHISLSWSYILLTIAVSYFEWLLVLLRKIKSWNVIEKDIDEYEIPVSDGSSFESLVLLAIKMLQ